jgi:hypothetical protein
MRLIRQSHRPEKNTFFSKKAKMFAYKRTNPHLSERSGPETATFFTRFHPPAPA